MALSGDDWLRVIVVAFGWMLLDGCGWLCVLAAGFGWPQVAFSDLQF